MSRSQELELRAAWQPRLREGQEGRDVQPEPPPANCHAHTDPARTLIRVQQERSLLKDKLSLDELLRNL